MEDVFGALFAHERAQVALAAWLNDDMSAETPTRYIYSSAELPVQWAIEFLQLTDTESLYAFRYNCRCARSAVCELALDLRKALLVKPDESMLYEMYWDNFRRDCESSPSTTPVLLVPGDVVQGAEVQSRYKNTARAQQRVCFAKICGSLA